MCFRRFLETHCAHKTLVHNRIRGEIIEAQKWTLQDSGVRIVSRRQLDRLTVFDMLCAVRIATWRYEESEVV